MRLFALQTLTWATIVAAVVSAFWLAAVDLGWSEWRSPFNGDTGFQAPAEPTQAGSPRPATREPHAQRTPDQRPR